MLPHVTSIFGAALLLGSTHTEFLPLLWVLFCSTCLCRSREHHTHTGFLTTRLFFWKSSAILFKFSSLFFLACVASKLPETGLTIFVCAAASGLYPLPSSVCAEMKAGYRQKAASILTSWVEQKWALSNRAGVYQLLSHPLSQHPATHPQKKATALKSFRRSRITLNKPTVNWKEKMKNFQDIRSLLWQHLPHCCQDPNALSWSLVIPHDRFCSNCLFPSSSVLFIMSHWCFSVVCKPTHLFITSLALSQQLLASAKPCSCGRNGTDFNLQFARKQESEPASCHPSYQRLPCEREMQGKQYRPLKPKRILQSDQTLSSSPS